jgi:hypothetical protein
VYVPTLLLELALLAAAPEDDAVDAAIATAQAQAAAGDLDEALATVREARETSEEPDLLFVEAQLLRLHGDCPTALERYRAFLATDPPAEDRAVAEANAKACEETIEQEPPPPVVEPETAAPPLQPPPPREPEPAPRPDRSQRQLGVTIVLWTGGAAILATGAGLYGAAWGERRASTRDALTLDEYLERERNARVMSGVGIAGLAVGATVLVVAAVRQAILAKRKRSARRASVLGSRGRLGDAWQ